MGYLAVGNPTIDIYEHHGPVVGGTVVYASLQAARLGLAASLVGRGSPSQNAEQWHALALEVELRLESTAVTTQFRNAAGGTTRTQIVQDWAGPLASTGPLPPCQILHLAPVAQEVLLEVLLPAVGADFVGLTPQGLLRRWDATGAVRLGTIEVDAGLAKHVNAAVVADYEYEHAAPLMAAIVQAGGLVVVTQGASGCEVHSRTGIDQFPAHLAGSVLDDTGAGDVFAAALFVELAQGSAVADAVRFASVAAAFSIQGIGASAIASREQIAGCLLGAGRGPSA